MQVGGRDLAVALDGDPAAAVRADAVQQRDQALPAGLCARRGHHLASLTSGAVTWASIGVLAGTAPRQPVNPAGTPSVPTGIRRGRPGRGRGSGCRP